MKPEGLKQQFEGLKCQICGQEHCKFKDHSLRRADVFDKLNNIIARLEEQKKIWIRQIFAHHNVKCDGSFHDKLLLRTYMNCPACKTINDGIGGLQIAIKALDSTVK